MMYGKKLLVLPFFLIGLSLFFSPIPMPKFPLLAIMMSQSHNLFDLTANPGDTLSSKVRIRNNTTSPLPIKLSVKKMKRDLNGI